MPKYTVVKLDVPRYIVVNEDGIRVSRWYQLESDAQEALEQALFEEGKNAQ